MAFLCPVRIRNNSNRKSKKKKDLVDLSGGEKETIIRGGRITGSSSIETLVVTHKNSAESISGQQQQNHQQLMTVLHDFTPCVDDELQVKRNDTVSLLYREHDWAYVLIVENEGGGEGFIPFSYLTPKDEEEEEEEEEEELLDEFAHNVNHFYKDPFGPEYIVLYSFTARDENDVSVERGEKITVLNKDDNEWFWVLVKRGSGVELEGFVPSAFVFPFNFMEKSSSEICSENPTTAQLQQNHQIEQGTELVMLYDYKAQAPDDLSVRRGDWVYADMKNQTVEGWLWAFTPKHKKYGFIPKAYARPPAMTSL